MRLVKAMCDLAEAILANLPPLEAVGYRLLVQRMGSGFPTIWEAKAVTAGDRLVYLARRPRGADDRHAKRYARDAPVPPKSEWETLLATNALALKYLLRELLQDFFFADVFVLLMPPCSTSDDRAQGVEVPIESYCPGSVGGGDGSVWTERALDEAIAALGVLRGPASGPFSWES